MIVLDTNVISEIMLASHQRSQSVVAWMRGMDSPQLFTTAISVAEVLGGVATLPEGRRRSEKLAAAELIFGLFRARILPFDEPAARTFARVVAMRRQRGLGIDIPDLQIAAIARATGMAVATRNISDFAGCGVELIDPWAAA